MSPVCYVRGSTADWSDRPRRSGTGGRVPAAVRPLPAHKLHITATRYIYHPLTNVNPLQHNQERGEVKLLSLTLSRQCFHMHPYLYNTPVHRLSDDSLLLEATTDSSDPAAESYHKPNQSLWQTVSSLLFRFNSANTEQRSGEIKCVFM